MSTPRKHPRFLVGEVIGIRTVIQAGLRHGGKCAVLVRCACGDESLALERNLRRPGARGCRRCADAERARAVASCRQCGEQFAKRKASSEFCSKSCSSRFRMRPVPRDAPLDLPEVAGRFWSKVDKGPGCWTWTGATQNYGYGAVTIHGLTRRAHRVSWELAHGPIPDGLHVCHRCDNPPCVNPDHLFLGTAQDNVDDKDAKGRGRNQVGPWVRRARRTGHDG